MTSPFTCPHCGGFNEAAGNNAGQNATCKHCGKEIDVPRRDSREPFFSSRGVKLFLLLILAMVLIDAINMGLGLLLPAVQAAREAARREHCTSNLRQIASAMHYYHEQNGCFPPAFVTDKTGKPMHSWRALLLPYLDSGPGSLADKYNFDEPWDSPNNRKVTDVVVKFYQCPTQPDSKQPTTNYMMVVGPHTISDGPHSRKEADITDGVSNSIMLVEVADSDVRWAEPKDLSFDLIDFTINGSKRPGIGSHHSGGVNMAFCDGHISFLSDETKPGAIKAMLTIDGGEKIPGEDLY